jgi:hypothetical protein
MACIPAEQRMKYLHVRLAALAVLMAGPVFASPPTVNPEPMDMGVEITAKIGMEKSKRNALAASMNRGGGSDGGYSGSGGECGNVNINSNEKKSNSGIKDMFGRQTTTIVTGPVINMAKCK